MTLIRDLITQIPPQPHGNIDDQVSARLRAWVNDRDVTLSDVALLVGDIARAHYLINRPSAPGDDFPTGGAPVAMRPAA